MKKSKTVPFVDGARMKEQHLVPGPLAIAIATGRPELARLIPAAGDPEANAAAMSDYAVALVTEIQHERSIMNVMEQMVEVAIGNAKGSLRTLERVQEALLLIANGHSAEDVLESLHNPNAKEDR